MTAECQPVQLEFQDLGRRRVVGDFDGGNITSDAGALLLRELEHRRGLIQQFSRCFVDGRDQRYVEHSLPSLLAQRVFGICLGYEDLVDHEWLRQDPLIALACQRLDLMGQQRRRERDRGKPLAGKSTLQRLETAPEELGQRYKRISWDPEAIEQFFVSAFLDSYDTPPQRIILDFDATDDPIHGHQEGRFFHGFFDCYCYLPLYVFCGEHLLAAKLRRSNIDASAGAAEELQRIVAQIRTRWPAVEIWVRADSGFCREPIMRWCEDNHVGYVVGLARNPRLTRLLQKDLKKARRKFLRTGTPTRRFKDFTYRTLDSWSRRRRVIGKAEHLPGRENPRYVVTNLPKSQIPAQQLYEQIYCARGEMENRIKEQQLQLFADRTSAATMRANQMRLWFASLAYVLLNTIRESALQDTEFARAQCATIRLKLMKIGALVRVSLRRVTISFASGYPYRAVFANVLSALARGSPLQA